MFKYKTLLQQALIIIALGISSSVYRAHYLINPYIIAQIGPGITVDKEFEAWGKFLQLANTSASARLGGFVNTVYTDDWLLSIEILYNTFLSKQKNTWRHSASHHSLALVGKGNFPIDENSDWFLGVGLGIGGLEVNRYMPHHAMGDLLFGVSGEAKRYGLALIEVGYNRHLYNGIYGFVALRNTYYLGAHAPHRDLNSPSDLHIHVGFKADWF